MEIEDPENRMRDLIGTLLSKERLEGKLQSADHYQRG